MKQKFNPELIVNFRDVWNVKIHLLGESADLSAIRKFRENQRYFNISDSFFNELEDFSQRNSIEIIEDYPSHICLRCLKAHIIYTGRKAGIPQLIIDFMANQVSSEAGHEGYYSDKGKIIKIES